MFSSMTAFGNNEVKLPQGIIHWDIKSVNHRYYEASFKLPELFQSLEQDVRDRLKKKINRGKIYCTLTFDASSTEEGALEINQSLANQLMAAIETLSKELKSSTQPSALEFLRWPGMVKVSNQAGSDVLFSQVLAAFEEVMKRFINERAREGNELKNFIELRLAKIQAIIQEIKKELPKELIQYRKRLLDKIKELDVQMDPHRLEQEVVFIAQKIDVNEELDRLDAHLKAVETLCKEGGVIGRHLDFFMQELNREANTLASKSISATVTQETVELKVLIEQIREQVQNIE